MCGITGYLSKKSFINPNEVLANMTQQLIHRGPDDSGIWFDTDACIGLGQRRLSIVDLSPAGHQPMFSSYGQYVFVFNGEIYNHLDLRKEIEQSNAVLQWRGHSDTETLLMCFEIWGIQKTLEKAMGMFAFALWDKKARVLTLARDRLGEKPLYYGWQGSTFLFGSELKALRNHPEFKGEIDRNAVASFMRYGNVSSPYSIYQGISKLTPGCLATISLQNPIPIITAYWSLTTVAEYGAMNPFLGNRAEASGQLEQLIKNSVQRQMIADVPLGAFLSGGVDSSIIVALMQAQSSRAIQTFTIGFHDAQFNEAHYAMAVAKHLGTEHNELYVSAEDALVVIPKIPTLYDEPFADSSQIPTFLVSQLARKHVTVALSGDAGDELFCGYSRYFFAKKLWSILRFVPLPLRQLIRTILTTIPSRSIEGVSHRILSLLKKNRNSSNLADKLKKILDLLAAPSSLVLYDHLLTTWSNSSELVLGSVENRNQNQSHSSLGFVQQMMLQDSHMYLPDDILTKVDRAAMGVSLETRVPFLDRDIVEFSWTLPIEMNHHSGMGKQLLRDVLYKYVPKSLIERPKQGFGVPIGDWLRGPLKNWANELLDPAKIRREGFLNPEIVSRAWNEHGNGERNWQSQLWTVIMFESWLESVKL